MCPYYQFASPCEDTVLTFFLNINAQGIRMLKGEVVNLRAAEKDDVSLVAEWWSNSQYMGEHQEVTTIPKARLEKVMLEDAIFFKMEKCGTKIGHINDLIQGRMMEIGFALVPSERGKGYGTEAVQLMVDYLFISKDIVRIQALPSAETSISIVSLETSGTNQEYWQK